MNIRPALLFVTLFLLSLPLPLRATQDLPQAQRVVLDNPEVIMLEFAPLTRQVSADVFEKMSGPFKPGTTIKFHLMGTNTSLITLVVRGWDTYAQNKPRLLRDNQELAYRKDMAELIKARHTKASAWEPTSVRGIKLNPNEPKFLQTLSLADWYEPLGPGHYVLFTQHRFVPFGKWVESAAISFEVCPIEG
ncbi:MAG: hypothetical protein AABN95_22830 [Acidobacteriota bacterium]